jgi:hypothetical protein
MACPWHSAGSRGHTWVGDTTGSIGDGGLTIATSRGDVADVANRWEES